MNSTIISGGPVHNYKFRKLSSRGGGRSEYPWQSTPINGWFFKPVSKEDLDRDKGRPGYPKNLKVLGIKYTTEKTFCEETKQYGYLCTRLK